MAIIMRPYKFLSNLELVNLFAVSKVSSIPLLIQNANHLTTLSSKLIGLKATSFYMGNSAGRVFSAGESIKELKSTLTSLKMIGQSGVMDYCAEGETSIVGMDHSAKEIENSIQLASDFENLSVAVKLTSLMQNETLERLNEIQLKICKNEGNAWGKSVLFDCSTEKLLEFGLSINEVSDVQKGVERARRISKLCMEKGVNLMIDAEQSYFQAAIDGLTAALQKEFNTTRGVVLNTFQSYLKNSTQNLENYFAWTFENQLKSGVKLVRGAYMNEEARLSKMHNYESPINISKEATDNCYNYNLSLCIHSHSSQSSLCIASHNDQSVHLGKELISEKRLHRKMCGITFAQLLGMKSQLSLSLSEENYVVQKYVPFGPFEKLIPYLVRRANEQSAMVVEISQQLELIIQEIRMRNE